jgi:hypothetical protein
VTVQDDHLPLAWTVGLSCVFAAATADPLWLVLIAPAVAADLLRSYRRRHPHAR